MMTKEELIIAIGHTLLKTKAVKLANLAKNQTLLIRDLIDLTFFKDTSIAFRAAWILEHAEKYFPEKFASELFYFLESYPIQNNNSCRRHYTKILMNVLKSNSIPSNFDYTAIIEATFGWLADQHTPVAVKANCMDILYSLKECDDWIAEELKAQLGFLLNSGTAAIQSRGKKFLAKLCAK